MFVFQFESIIKENFCLPFIAVIVKFKSFLFRLANKEVLFLKKKIFFLLSLMLCLEKTHLVDSQD